MKRTIIAAALLAIAQSVNAQTVTTNRIEWDYTASLSEVTSYAQTVSIDTAAVTTPPTCAQKAGSTTEVTCAVTVPVLAAGAHAISITATLNGQSSTTIVNGIDPTRGPKQPNGNPRVTRVITITIP